MGSHTGKINAEEYPYVSTVLPDHERRFGIKVDEEEIGPIYVKQEDGDRGIAVVNFALSNTITKHQVLHLEDNDADKEKERWSASLCFFENYSNDIHSADEIYDKLIDAGYENLRKIERTDEGLDRNIFKATLGKAGGGGGGGGKRRKPRQSKSTTSSTGVPGAPV